jgi:tRNA (cytidine/uridine-2'-O-)-methyltransferase
VAIARHASFEAFEGWRKAEGRRLLLLSTRAETVYTQCAFRTGDVLMVGRESAGVPEAVHEAADMRIKIAIRAGMRSLNVAVAAAIVAGEALRQIEAVAVGGGAG